MEAPKSPMPPRRLPIGAEACIRANERGVQFRVWAPTHDRVTLVVESPTPREVVLEKAGGHHAVFVPGLEIGVHYRFRLGDSAALVADPASRFQPDGPFGPSEVIDPSFAWTDQAWRGLPAHAHVFYELHIGTFTPTGTWAAAMEQLPFLAELGVTTLEVMPIAEFAGQHNWGYDGVNWFAPTQAYGRPEDVRAFVDRAHSLGLAVILDVVYNHFGPAGNTMFDWCPDYRAGAGDWGDDLAFDTPRAAGMRELVISNAAYWIDEFHFDGLRLDATQAIKDQSGEHVIAALVKRARDVAGERRIVIVGENEPQDSALFGMGVDALWNDDFHHTARVAATGLREGYLHDYKGTPQELLSATKRGFLYQGQLYPWQRNPRGTPVRHPRPAQFVQFLENHDQVANVGLGERLTDLSDPGTLRALTAMLLLSPAMPLLFQGQETGTRIPWLFFVDHAENLHAPIREGRAKFVAQFSRLATPEVQTVLRDPCVPETFRACVLDPTERDFSRPLPALHRDLLALRKAEMIIATAALDATRIDGALLGEHTFVMRYFGDDASDDRLLLVNLGRTFVEAVVPEPLLAPLRDQGWLTRWSSEHPSYGGHGTPTVFTHDRLSIPAHSAIWLAPDASASLRVTPSPPSGDKVLVDP
ncbi:MAG TPA: alpha-amylase family glycosyl hydrolase [Kofleriaceae bacterium]|jgi:maltooligosyltrehalose trehalohydrolase